MVSEYLKCKAFVGERIEVVSFWQNKVTRGAALGVLSAALLGCANAESLSPQAKTETQAEVPKPTAAEEFTTKGKLTKTIETPWGLKEVYDPARDPLVISEFKPWFDSGFKPLMAPILAEGSLIGNARKTKGFDYLRHQCMSVAVGNQCAHFNYTFKVDCEANQNMHELSLSECEKENLITLKTSHWGVPECRGEASLKNSGNYQLKSSLEDSLEDYFSMTCDVWRGEDGEMYWLKEQIYPGEVPTRRFKEYRLKESKPKE